MKKMMIWHLISLTALAMLSQQKRFNQQGKEDPLLEGAEAAASVMIHGNDQHKQFSYAFIIDELVQASSLTKLSAYLEDHLGVGIFKILPRATDDSIWTMTAVIAQIQKLRQVSRSLSLVVASDDSRFLASTLRQLLQEGFLVWPQRLLLVTRLPPEELQLFLGEDLSLANAILITTGDSASSDGGNVFIHLPFSHRFVKVATWNPEGGLKLLNEYQLFSDKFNILLDGGRLMVTGEEYPPHLKLELIPDEVTGRNKLKFSGPVITLLDTLASSINFTYGLTRPPDRGWGYLLPNGSWTGMVGQAARKEVDISLGPLAITLDRTRVVDYTSALLVDYVRIGARRGETEVDTWGFAMPLAAPVWLGALVAFGAVLIAEQIFHCGWTASAQSYRKHCLSNYLRVLLQQDLIPANVNGWRERILLGMWMITILVLIEGYSCNLMSLLAVRYVSQPFQAIKDVVDDDRITMLWEGNTAYIQHLMSSKSGIFYEVAETRKKNRLSYLSSTDYPEAMKTKVFQGDHVLMIEDLALKMLLAKHFTETGLCSFYLSKEMFLPFTFAMILQNHSPLGPAINKRVKAMTESGLYDYWLRNAVPNSTTCVHAPTKILVQSTLSIYNLWGIFVLLCTGYTIGILSFFMEHGYSKLS